MEEYKSLQASQILVNHAVPSQIFHPQNARTRDFNHEA